jgi:hypothetical protein
VTKKVSIVCFFILAACHLHAQQFNSLLNQLDSSYPQEKIYLHFDRPYYNAGETIWFKAYLTSDNLPSTISKTMYAELLDEKGNILQRKVLPVIQSSAASNFDLPDSLQHTLLYVRAYTAWMLNFDSSSLYVKPIAIITADKKIKSTTPPVLYELQFFPEGGDLVEGVNSRVAFKANTQFGIPFDISGTIIDHGGNKIAYFTSVHDGMGYFNFTPLAGETYIAIWKDKKGTKHETLLPEAKKEGVVLSIDNSNDQLIYSLSRPDSVGDAFTSYFVVAQMQQQLMYSATINMRIKKIIHAPIIIDSFPDGILQVTVFNADTVPVAERVMFINHGNYYFNTDLHAVEKNLDKRGRNVLQIDVGGELKTNMSIAVTDGDLNTSSKNEESIFSSLLLTSDIKGYVYNPAYYFSSDEDSVKQQLDLVMMTNGWRRFRWKDLLAEHWPVIKYQPEGDISIKGKIYGLSKILLSGKELILFVKTKNAVSNGYIVPVTKEGDFKLSDQLFYDTARLYYQFNDDKDKTLTSSASFSIFDPFTAPLRSNDWLMNSFLPIYPDSSTLKKNRAEMSQSRLSAFLQNGGKILDSVVVKTKEKTPEEKMDDEYTNGFFKGGQAHTFIINNDSAAIGYLNVLSYLQGKVAGLTIYVNGSDASATWRGSKTTFYRDEMNADLDALQTIPMSDVAMIKVFDPPFFGGVNGGGGGAIAVYTKRGGGDFTSVKGLDFSMISGYSTIKEFYSPNYSETNDLTQPDHRTTLYWNPFLLMDSKNRRITIPFYNSDDCKKIKVIVEGMNETGQLTREEKIFE